MKPLSVLETLREAVQLWVRHFWLLLALSIITALPNELMAFNPYPESTQPLNPAEFGIGLAVLISGIILAAMKTAALLGVLKRQDPQMPAGRAMAESIRTYTWTLIRVAILLMIIAFLITTPFTLVEILLLSAHLSSGPPLAIQALAVFLAIVYLIFVKYALADPLVVVENMRARAALKQSWRMTKGRFWYVLGCYVILGVGEYGIDWLVQQLVRNSTSGYPAAVNAVAVETVTSLWVLTAWRMYIKIKAAESNEPPPHPVDLLAPMQPR